MAAGRARPATESAPRDCRCPAKESAADRTKSASVWTKRLPLSDRRDLCPDKQEQSRGGCQSVHITIWVSDCTHQDLGVRLYISGSGCQSVHITIQCRGRCQSVIIIINNNSYKALFFNQS